MILRVLRLLLCFVSHVLWAERVLALGMGSIWQTGIGPILSSALFPPSRRSFFVKSSRSFGDMSASPAKKFFSGYHPDDRLTFALNCVLKCLEVCYEPVQIVR